MVRCTGLPSLAPPVGLFASPLSFVVDGILTKHEAAWYIQEAERAAPEVLLNVMTMLPVKEILGVVMLVDMLTYKHQG